MHTNSAFFKPNEKVATCSVLADNLGLRISDILNLRTSSIIKDGDRYRYGLDKLNSKDNKDTLEIPTGFGGLDSIITGLNKSDLILLAARDIINRQMTE